MCYNRIRTNGATGVPVALFRIKGMNKVKIKSYAKVNLTLEIKGVENGYHQIQSLVANVDVYDLLVLKKSKDKLSFVTMKGMGSESIPPQQNNALKAAEAFSKAFDTCGAEITVFKNIPIGAGLGGSSADVAGVLNGMAKLYGVTDREKLKEIADELGSDTGYMLNGGFAKISGRGEKVQRLGLKNTLHFLLICPQSSVSAGACYRTYDEMPKTLEFLGDRTQNCIEALQKNDQNELGRCLMNDLFRSAYALNEDVGTALEEAQSFSPLGAVMTGSGSCVLAMFETPELCAWAKSRYRGKFRTIVTKTLVPDYVGKEKGWKNPFVLSEDEIEELE